MLDEKGAVEKTFTAAAAVEAKETQTLTLSWPWADPRLWDVGQPNLYTLRLKVTGAGLDDEYNQEFGFREFWVEGASFSSTAPRSTCGSAAFTMGRAPQVGDNFSEFGIRDGGYPRRCLRRGAGTRTTPIARDTWRPYMSSTPTST